MSKKTVKKYVGDASEFARLLENEYLEGLTVFIVSNPLEVGVSSEQQIRWNFKMVS